jgi:toxin ParE1/3/4
MAAHKLQLSWSADAENDLLSIWSYGSEEWSADVADAYMRLLMRACTRLIENPELGRRRDELISGLRSFVIDPHVVFYRLSGAAVEIVRVVHQREDIETIISGRV